MRQIILGAKDEKGRVYPWASPNAWLVSKIKLENQNPLIKGKPTVASYVALFPYVNIGSFMDDKTYTVNKHPELQPVFLMVDMDVTPDDIVKANPGNLSSVLITDREITFIKEVKDPLIQYYRNRIGVQPLTDHIRDDIARGLSYWDFNRREYSWDEFNNAFYPVIMSYNRPGLDYPYDVNVTRKNLEWVFYLLSSTAFNLDYFTFGHYGRVDLSAQDIINFVNRHKQTLTAYAILVILKSRIFDLNDNSVLFLSLVPQTNLIKSRLTVELVNAITRRAFTERQEFPDNWNAVYKKGSLLDSADYVGYIKEKLKNLESSDYFEEDREILTDESYVPPAHGNTVDDEYDYDNYYDYDEEDPFYDDEDDYYEYEWEELYDEQYDSLEGVTGVYPDTMVEILGKKEVAKLLKNRVANSLVKRILEDN